MNDKQQMAAMGEHISEQAAQPMCMAKRIEELEAHLEKPTNRLAWRNTGSPNGLRRFMTQKQYAAQTPGVQKWYEPIRYEVPEGWQLVQVGHAVSVAEAVIEDHVVTEWDFRWQEISGYRCGYCSLSDDTSDGVVDGQHDHDCVITKARSILAAAPKPEAK